MGRLDGRLALVTGAGGGIGRGIAERFAAEGARVVVNDVDAAAAEAVAAELGAIAVAADVSRVEEVDRLFGELERMDVLVNNAGLTDVRRHVLDGDDAWFDDVIGVNLRGQFSCAARAARVMAGHGCGAIVNVSSVGAQAAHRGMVAYDASKGGIEAMTRALAVDLAPYGVRVNAIAPGDIATRGGEPAAARGDAVPLGRVGTPADVAGAAVFLASEDAAYVTGVTLPVDGGLLAQLRSPQIDPAPERTR
jgi:NAD(P)-dependent dehydrogenase (short-subunit alcohol dehydrogenase family)